MIKVIIGGIGSGKTLTTVKEIITRNRPCFTNFYIKFKDATRLKTKHIIKETVDEKGKVKLSVNWDFWIELIKEERSFDIYIDEAHDVLNSRKSMSSWNSLFTSWITQIRKLLGDSEESHLYLITQRLNSLDIIVRDLCHTIIYCQKVKTRKTTLTVIFKNGKKSNKRLNDVYIIKKYFTGTFCIEKFNAFIDNATGKTDGMSLFYGNPFFKYYESYSLVVFGESAYI